MIELAPDYLATLAAQVGSVSAFLGGFAATFLALFLTLGARSRPASIASVASAAASVCFVLAVVAATMLTVALHPHAPPGTIERAGIGRTVMGLGFMAGIAALLVAIGASGWVRSRRLGWTTATLAVAAFLVAALLLR